MSHDEVDDIPVLSENFFDEKPAPISRDAYEARLIAEHDRLKEEIATLTAERDGLRLLDETNRLEMERVRAALHAKKDETTSVAAARVWSELLAAEGRGRDVLSALGRPIIEDPVKAAQRIVAQRDEERKRAASVIDLDNRVREELGARPEESTATVARIAVNERNALRAELDRRDGSCAELVTERDALRANDEANIRERNHVRKIVDADPSETLIQAVRRCVGRADEQEVATLVAERDRQSKRGDDFLDMLRNIRAALGVGEGWTAAALVERAGQLRDDSVAYRSLRGRLVEVIDAPADFGDTDLLDLFKDRINEPFSDSEVALEEQIERLERDLRTTLDALHVATGRRP